MQAHSKIIVPVRIIKICNIAIYLTIAKSIKKHNPRHIFSVNISKQMCCICNTISVQINNNFYRRVVSKYFLNTIFCICICLASVKFSVYIIIHTRIVYDIISILIDKQFCEIIANSYYCR